MKNKAKHLYLFLLIALGVSASSYLLASYFTLKIGFPLDDAWIHQTFARNFAQVGEWAFLEGRIAGGSTSPLWTLLLAIGYLFRLPFLLWSFLMGAVLLFLMGVIGEKIFTRISPGQGRPSGFPLLGILLITEWHFIWAAFSGMETLLLSFMILLCAYLLVKENIRWLLAGLLAGLMIWVRPDGVLVLGPIMLLALVQGEKKIIPKSLVKITIGFMLLVIPYLVFNLQVAGEVWPTTFFAKQAEYAVLRDQPIFTRILDLYSQLFVGVGFVLLPGLFYSIYRMISTRNWWGIAFLLWVIGYVFVFVIRLPVVYQHGRYLIPVMPIFLVLSYTGYAELRNKLKGSGYWLKIVDQFWGITIIAVVMLFIFVGARAYAMDVAIIESEMVKASKWIADNTPRDSVIAAHDIGALGYFGDREIIDLAGLIEPEVIPIINDEAKLGTYIRKRKADYLFTFPGWYPELINSGNLIFTTRSEFSPSAGGENIQIYKLEY